MHPIPEFKPGILDARHLNALRDTANALWKLSVSGRAQLSKTAGSNQALHIPDCREFAALKLTAKGTGTFAGAYSWTLAEPIDESPWWEDGADEGTFDGDEPAIEVNGNTAISVPVYVWAWREPGVFGWRFQLGSCT